MNPSEWLFLTDENIDKEVVDFLRGRQFNVFDIKEAGMFRMPDREILTFAWNEKRIVISQDSDFGTLVFRDRLDFIGIIYLRPGHVSADVHVETLRAILDAGLEFKIPFVVVGENNFGSIKIRLRQL